MNETSDKKLLRVLRGERFDTPPIWMMRQAGRYLPEYRAVREKAGSFLNLCFNPELAAEVTLQPIRRFGFDGAILFSDILVIPHGLGQSVAFEAGEGPRLRPLGDFGGVDALADRLSEDTVCPIYETVRRVKVGLADDVTFLGFCGAPWTVATYMVAGRGGEDQMAARLMAYGDESGFQRLIDLLVETSIDYLVGQIDAGVDAVQIFDTWAGVLTQQGFERWCVRPIAAMVAGVKARRPGVPVIVFPKGAGHRLTAVVRGTGCDAVGLDWTVDPEFVRREIQPHAAVQGNLDPAVLIAGGAALDRAVDRTLSDFQSGRFIFNLGHGITPQTPIAHVERMISRVRGGR